jgi:hypothetical protein
MIIILSFESSVSFLDMLLILLRSLNNTPPLMSSIKEGHENSEVLTQLVLSCWRTLVQFTTSIPSNSRISLASWSSASTKGKRIVDSLNRLERWELCYQRCAWIVPTPTVSVFCRWVDSRIKRERKWKMEKGEQDWAWPWEQTNCLSGKSTNLSFRAQERDIQAKEVLSSKWHALVSPGQSSIWVYMCGDRSLMIIVLSS